MKWLSLNVIVLSIFGIFSLQDVCAESAQPVVIESITHSRESESKEIIRFKFTPPIVPAIFSLDGEKPRLVLDFPNSIYRGKSTIPLPESKMASAVRIGLHQTPVQKTRAVVDLSTKSKVQYSSEYSEQEKALLVVLTSENTVTAEIDSDEDLRGDLISSGQDIKLSSASVPPRETELNESADKTVAVPIVPMIHEISFDDSSKGEMVIFHLNDFFPPLVSAIENNSPRVVCDFMAANLSPNIQENITANGKYIKSIRIEEYQDPGKVQVVVNLFPDQDYDLQQVFFRKDNLFVLIINELVSPKVE